MTHVWYEVTGWSDFDTAEVLLGGPFPGPQEALSAATNVGRFLDLREVSLLTWCEWFAVNERLNQPVFEDGPEFDHRDFYTDYKGTFRPRYNQLCWNRQP